MASKKLRYTTEQVQRILDGANLTSVQRSAINSGITPNLVSQITTTKNNLAKITATDITFSIAAPLDSIPSFSEANWAQISEAAKRSTKPSWFTLGATKTLALMDGSKYTIRLCDTKANRYECVDTTKTQHAVLEFVELYKDTMKMNTTGINAGGWATSEMKTKNILTIWNLLPEDFKSIALNVKIFSTIGDGSTNTSTSENQIWLPSMNEIYSNNGTQYSWPQSELFASHFNKEDASGQFELYANNKVYIRQANNFSQKKELGESSSFWWWLRSPNPTDSSFFCSVHGNGSADFRNASNSHGVAPCFAI